MQIVTPIVSLVSLMIVLGQEKSLSSITGSYATIAFILSIDNMFADSFPDEVKSNAEDLNKAAYLKMGEDYNTFRKLVRRVRRDKGAKRFFNFLANVVINLWFFVISNFNIVLYSYFAPMFCILI